MRILRRYDIRSIDAGDAFLGPPSLQLPLGLTLESASIEPETNTIYAYLCTSTQENVRSAILYKIPLATVTQRSSQMLPLTMEEDGPVLGSVQTFAQSQLECKLPARFAFTLHGRLFFQVRRC